MQMSKSSVLTVIIFSFQSFERFLLAAPRSHNDSMRVIQTGLQAFNGRYNVEWTY
jgi:hypothetical protein